MSELLTPEWPMPRWLSPGTLNRSTATFPVSGLPLFGAFLFAHGRHAVAPLPHAVNTTNRGFNPVRLKMVGS